MNKVITPAMHFCLVLLLNTICTASLNAETLYQQLEQLNKQWSQVHVENPLFQKELVFQNHENLIQLHLELVETHLRKNPPKHLTEKQKKNRAKGLDILRAYWQKGVFPKNLHHSITIPYFIDDFNTACAVGHILRESGEVELAHHIAKEMNNAYLKDMAFEELPLWAEKMGFSLFELKWIQPSYSPTIEYYSNNEDIVQPDCGQNNGHIYLDFSSLEYEIDDPELLSEIEGMWYDSKHNLISMGDSLDNLVAGMYFFERDFPFSLPIGREGIGLKVIPMSDKGGPKIANTTIKPESCSMNLVEDFSDIYNFIVQNNYTLEYRGINFADGFINIELEEELPPENIAWYDYEGNHIGSGLAILNVDASYALARYNDYRHTSIYYAEITGLDNCKTFEIFEVPGDGHYELEVKVTPPTTPDANDGSIYITTPLPYDILAEPQYFWNFLSAFPFNIQHEDNNYYIGQAYYSNEKTINNLGVGTHSINIENNFGCSQTFEIQINTTVCENVPPCTDKLICEQIIESDCGQSNGSIQVSVNNTFPYEISYFNKDMGVIGAGCSIENLSSGIYYYQVTIDSLGSSTSYTEKVVLSDKNGPQVSDLYTSSFCSWNINYYDIENDSLIENDEYALPRTGIISISLEEELPEENIVWYDPFGNKLGIGYSIDSLYSINSFNDLLYGSKFLAENYVVHITDNNGCQTFQKITLDGSEYHEVWIGVQYNSDGQSNGVINILENNPISGEPLESYDIELTDIEGNTITDLNNLGSNVYQLKLISSCLFYTKTIVFGGCKDIDVILNFHCQTDSTFSYCFTLEGNAEQLTVQFTEPVDSILEVTPNIRKSFCVHHNLIEKGIQASISNNDGSCVFTIDEQFIAICSDSIIVNEPIDTVDTGLNTMIAEQNKFVLSPNPTRSQSIIQFISQNVNQVHYRLMDISGKLIQQKNINAQQGLNEYMLDCSNLKSGIYLLELVNGENRQVQKLIVE